MNTHANRTQDNKSQAVANADSQKQSSGDSTFQFTDNRPEAVAQRKLQEIANNGPQAMLVAQLQAMADNRSDQQQLIQRYAHYTDSSISEYFDNQIVQLARKRGGGTVHPVTAYPTPAGAVPQPGDIPVSADCIGAAHKIIDALEAAMKREGVAAVTKEKTETERGGTVAAAGATAEEKAPPKRQGFIIGVAQVGGSMIASYSGTIPPAAIAAIKSIVPKVIEANVRMELANAYVVQHAHVLDAAVPGRLQVDDPSEGGVPGGIAGFCAAFKLTTATEAKIEGMAEVLFAPAEVDGPNVQVKDFEGNTVTYEHRDIVPSCITCQEALPKISEEKSKNAEAKVRRQIAREAELGKLAEAKAAEKAAPLENISLDNGIIRGKIGELSQDAFASIREATASCLKLIEACTAQLSNEVPHTEQRQILKAAQDQIDAALSDILRGGDAKMRKTIAERSLSKINGYKDDLKKISDALLASLNAKEGTEGGAAAAGAAGGFVDPLGLGLTQGDWDNLSGDGWNESMIRDLMAQNVVSSTKEGILSLLHAE